VFELLVVDRGWCLHHFVERLAIAIGGPDLEAIFLVATERFGIGDQRFQARGGHRRTDHCNLGVQRVQQQLQSRQALLSVDDGALLQVARRREELLQDNGAKEMRCLRRVRRAQQACGDTLQVLPERLPLQLLVPDVRTLEDAEPAGAGAA
jgi:hypothetical protein